MGILTDVDNRKPRAERVEFPQRTAFVEDWFEGAASFFKSKSATNVARDVYEEIKGDFPVLREKFSPDSGQGPETRIGQNAIIQALAGAPIDGEVGPMTLEQLGWLIESSQYKYTENSISHYMNIEAFEIARVHLIGILLNERKAISD